MMKRHSEMGANDKMAVRTCRPDHETNQKKQGSVHKEAPGSTRAATRPNNSPQYLRQTMGSDSDFWQVSSSVIPLYTSPQVVVMSSIPSTTPRDDAPQLTDEQFWNRPSPFHITSTQLITLLISLLSNVPLVTHSVDVYTQLFLIVSMALVSTTTSEQRKSLARNPLHGSRAGAFTTRFITRSGFSIPRDQTHATVRNRRRRGFLHWLLHKTLHSSNQNSFPSGSSVSTSCRSSTPSFRCLQCLTWSERVSLPISSRPWLVVTTAISP